MRNKIIYQPFKTETAGSGFFYSLLSTNYTNYTNLCVYHIKTYLRLDQCKFVKFVA
jgi:hypothetical protein